MDYRQMTTQQLVNLLSNYGFDYTIRTSKKTLIQKCKELDEAHYSPGDNTLLTGWEIALLDDDRRKRTIFAIDAWKDFF